MDLGLPSGTLWLDRWVGAPSPSEPGLFYQWGDIVGHDINESYEYNLANYEAKGLNLISYSLDEAHDAARTYYGPIAKMPTNINFEELIENCDISLRENGLLRFTSKINGSAITIPPCGVFIGLQRSYIDEVRAWSSVRGSARYAYSLHSKVESSTIALSFREYGSTIMAVHS